MRYVCRFITFFEKCTLLVSPICLHLYALPETTNLVQDRADKTLKRRYLGNKLPVLTLFKGVTQTVTLPTADSCCCRGSEPCCKYVCLEVNGEMDLSYITNYIN